MGQPNSPRVRGKQHAALVKLLAQFYEPKRRLPLALWAVRQGVGRALDADRVMTFGSANGTADLIGILRGGQHIEIEVKTGSARLSEAQVERRAIVEQWGGRYLVVSSLCEVQLAVDRWIKELR